MKKSYVIGLDIGTSSIKGVLASCDGKETPVTGRVPFVYRTDAAGCVEIDAKDYLESCYALLRQLSATLPEGGELKAVSAASASGNILFLDKDYTPISPIVNWQDKRTGDEVLQILGADFDTQAYFLSTGWAFDGKTFPLATLCRLKVHEPGLFAPDNFLCMSTEYLYRTLCGAWGLSTSAGTPFYLIDQKSGKYRSDILGRFGLTEKQVPAVLPVGTVVGLVTEEGARKSGLPVGTPLVAGTFDHPSAARGVGVLKPGQMLLSCGTSWVGFYPTKTREIAEENRMLIDPFLSEEGGAWAGMVSLASVASRIDGYVFKYFSDGDNPFRSFEAAAKESAAGAGGPVLTLTDADDEAVIRSYSKPQIARAIMECVVNMLKKDFERLAKGGVKAESAVMVGGPTQCPTWTEVIEQITGMPVTVKHGQFAGAVGAAMMAGIGAGVWKNEAEAGRYI